MNKARLRGLYTGIIDTPGYQLLMTTPLAIVDLCQAIACGGDKSTQQQDIRKAIEYGRDYNDTSQNAN